MFQAATRQYDLSSLSNTSFKPDKIVPGMEVSSFTCGQLQDDTIDKAAVIDSAFTPKSNDACSQSAADQVAASLPAVDVARAEVCAVASGHGPVAGARACTAAEPGGPNP